jgi:hypothetical protein
MNIKEILIAARAKIERPENWTQGVFARDSQGRDVTAKDKTSVCWCALGAVIATNISYEDEELATNYLRIELDAYGNSITKFNDTSTHAEVLAMFDRAISVSELD